MSRNLLVPVAGSVIVMTTPGRGPFGELLHGARANGVVARGKPRPPVPRGC